MLTPIIEDPRLSQESSKAYSPDETRRHISTTDESPLPSPIHIGGSASPLSASDHGQSRTDIGPISDINGHYQGRTSPDSIHGDGSDEFLDMGASDENQVENQDSNDQQMHSSPGPLSPSKKKHRTRATVEDFPMPPSHSAVPLSTHHHNSSSHSTTTMPAQTQQPRDQKSSHALTHSLSLEGPLSTPTIDSPLPSSYLSPTKPSSGAGSNATFRALPLVYDDLKTTRITVLHSSVKPNDRGKDVLSFVIEVDPRNTKDPWKIEKLYSDFLGLDQRMRNTVAKNVAKKMGVLPEGKVWRDHAPAKADQRKVSVATTRSACGK